ncbi:hypothetical protein [Streptosporangium canum]|uniref:hypothetical protein n=1 Tax=Streptosporangium canum TaxID=324952 RepID=UPI0033A226CB
MKEQMIAAAAALVAAWLVGRSIFTHNRVKCPRCGGSKVTRSSLFTARYRACGRCGGAGDVRAVFGSKK